jgi:predicted lipopolysaccharide heptosyltransferase III
MSIPEIDRSAVRKILVIKMRAIGDVLLSTVVIPNLSEAFPDVPMDFLTEPPAAPVVQGNPRIGEVIVFDRRAQSGAWLLREIRRRRYDLVIDLFGNPRTALVTRMSGARYRVGYAFRGRKYAYTHLVVPRGGVVHNTQFNLDAIERIGVSTSQREVFFPLSSEDEGFADNYISNNGLSDSIIVVLNTSGGWYTKKWGAERYAAMADRLASEYDVRIVLTWGPGELSQVQEIAGMMKRPVAILPPTTLGQMGALIKRSACMITNDSGPMHVAASLGVPVVAVYGPTNPVLQGPYGTRSLVIRNDQVPCLGCNLVRCPIDHPCMKDLSVEQVWEKSSKFLSDILQEKTSHN